MGNWMSSGAVIQTAMGIAVSIGLFFFGYRQTIGARRERAKAATTSLVRALLRRLVLEQYHPKYADIERLIDGRSIEHQVRSTDLLRPNQLLAIVYAQVFDSDLITPDRRVEVEASIVKALADGESRNSAPETQSRAPFYWRSRVFLGLLTTLAGGLTIVGFAKLRRTPVDPMLLTTVVAGSLLAIGAIILIRRLRESGDQLIDIIGGHDLATVLPRKVARALRRWKLVFDRDIEIGNNFADFLVDTSQGKVLLHVLPSQMAPQITLIQTRDRIQRMKDAATAADAIVIVSDAQPIPDELRTGETRVMSVSMFCSYVASIGPSLPVKRPQEPNSGSV